MVTQILRTSRYLFACRRPDRGCSNGWLQAPGSKFAINGTQDRQELRLTVWREDPLKHTTYLKKFIAYALCAWMTVCNVLPAAAQGCNPDADPNCGVYSSLPKQPPPSPATDMSRLSSDDT